MTLFASFHPTLQEVLISGLGWSSLRPVQEETYLAVAEGADVVVLAPTAGGKTESAFIPVLDRLLKDASSGIAAIYISPLKALINDQEDRIRQMCERAGLSVASQHGDVAARDRWKFSREGELPHILLTTPESLEVLLGDPDSRHALTRVQFVIIDEIHAFMETDRGVHLRCLLDRLESRHAVQRIGLSATVGNPQDLLAWMSAPGRKQRLVQIPSPSSSKQFSFVVEREFTVQVRAVARAVFGKKALVFVDSRSFAEKLIGPLSAEVPNVYLHHSSVSPEDRAAAEEAFSGSGGVCTICTSTMELGIDIGDLDLVVQYGAPKSVASFLQRLGRTGRRGKPSVMVFVLATPCDLLISAAVIESAMRHESEPLVAPTPSAAWHVLVQQLFLLLRNRMSLGKGEIIASIHAQSPFSSVSADAIALLLDHLTANAYLMRDGDLYMIGPAAERELGKSNWLALISVISDSGGYLAVLPDGTVVGTLDPRFVAGDPGKTFSFTGKNWRLLFRDDIHRRVLVESSAAGRGDLKRPFWSGGAGGTGGGSVDATPLVCRSVASLLSRGETRLPLPPAQKEMLDELLRMLPDDFQPGVLHVRCEPEALGWSVVVATFFGIRANMVLSRLIKNRLAPGHTIRYTPFAIRIADWDTAEAGTAVCRILAEISAGDLRTLAGELPEVPSSVWKFGSLLPDALLGEMAIFGYYHLPELLASLASPIHLAER